MNPIPVSEHRLGKLRVSFDERLVDTKSFLHRIKRALPYLSNAFTTMVIDGVARRPVTVMIVGRKKEGSSEKITQIYNRIIKSLDERGIDDKKIKALKDEYLSYRLKNDILNCLDILDDLKNLEEETPEELALELEVKANTDVNEAEPLLHDEQAEEILEVLASLQSKILFLKPEFQDLSKQLIAEIKALTKKLPGSLNKLKRKVGELYQLLDDKNFMEQSATLAESPSLKFAKSVYEADLQKLRAHVTDFRRKTPLKREFNQAQKLLDEEKMTDFEETLKHLKEELAPRKIPRIISSAPLPLEL